MNEERLKEEAATWRRLAVTCPWCRCVSPEFISYKRHLEACPDRPDARLLDACRAVADEVRQQRRHGILCLVLSNEAADGVLRATGGL